MFNFNKIYFYEFIFICFITFMYLFIYIFYINNLGKIIQNNLLEM